MIRDTIITKLRNVYRGLTDDEKAVACVLAKEGCYQQDDIARLCPQIKEHLGRDSKLRAVRQIIHDLRVKHGICILSSPDGYWIPNDRDEIEAYLDVSEAQARAAARSHMVTVARMRQNVDGLRERLFEL